MSDTWNRLSAATAGMRREPISETKHSTFYLSPFNVPDAFRHVISQAGVTTEFKFDDSDEPQREIPLHGGVVIKMGKKSQRIYSIFIPKELIKAAMNEAVNELNETLAKKNLAVGAIGQLPDRLLGDNRMVTQRLFERNMLVQVAH